MQLSILPTSFPCTPQFEVHGRVIPAKEVGGDFYDIYRLEDGRLGIVIADVSGKGIPAALFMMVCRTLLKGIAIGMGSPAEALTEANSLLHAENQASMFVTVFYGVFDPRTGALTYANAGHEPPVLRRTDGSTEALPFTGGIPLGIVDDMVFEERTSTLSPGDFAFLYTDGVTEALNEAEEEFGNARVLDAIAGVNPGQAREAVEALVQTVVRFSGEAEQFDDLTCLVLKAGESAQ